MKQPTDREVPHASLYGSSNVLGRKLSLFGWVAGDYDGIVTRVTLQSRGVREPRPTSSIDNEFQFVRWRCRFAGDPLANKDTLTVQQCRRRLSKICASLHCLGHLKLVPSFRIGIGQQQKVVTGKEGPFLAGTTQPVDTDNVRCYTNANHELGGSFYRCTPLPSNDMCRCCGMLDIFDNRASQVFDCLWKDCTNEQNRSMQSEREREIDTQRMNK